MDYSHIITDSFKIFWKHKSLWLFGVILALCGQGDYGFSVNYQERVSFSTGSGGSPDFPNPFDNPWLASFFENPMPYLIGFGALGLCWWLIAAFIGWWAQGALIGMVAEIDRTGSTSIGGGWTVGQNYVLRLFGLAVLLGLPTFLIFLPALAGGLWFFSQFFDVFAALAQGQAPPPQQMEEKFATIFPTILAGFACLLPLICVGAIVAWVLGLLNKIAARSCVLENLGITASLKRGWDITRRNILYVLLTWFVLAVIAGIFGLVGALSALIVWIPTARALLHNDWSTMTIVTAILTGVYFLVIAIGLGGILNSFNSTLWTKLYQGFLARENVTTHPA